VLNRTFGCVRLVYNKALDARTAAWSAERRRVTYPETSAMLTAWKQTEELAFLNEVAAVPLQQGLRHLQSAFVAHCSVAPAIPVSSLRDAGVTPLSTRALPFASGTGSSALPS
jgi:hypothetical protein